MKASARALLVALCICSAPVCAQQAGREPHIGYLYPAGGRRGSVFRVTVGGQSLRGTTDVYVTGAGVEARVLEVYPPLRNVDAEERAALVEKMRTLIAQRWTRLHADGRVGPTPPWQELQLPPARRPKTDDADDPPASQPAALPKHPLLYDLDHKSLPELLHIRHALMRLRKGGQVNSQLAESVLIEMRVDRNAELGDRELRLGGPQGLTNPLTFEVGAWLETTELEDNDPDARRVLPDEPPLELPIVLNGQIMPGDVDRFRFHADAGQRIVIETSARRLIPYLADAVPGWFQATLALYDADGNELAYADDYRFDPDPVLYYEIPADGAYTIEIRDSIYRGREDFVYRINVGPSPFITAVFPLGTWTGHERYAAIEGWNLPTRRLSFDADTEAGGIRQKRLGLGKRLSNRVTYAVDPVRADLEAEENDTVDGAQRLLLPRIVDGRIDQPGDVDMYQFKGRAGMEIVAEVVARRLNSPLDSLLRLTDTAGTVIAWNDDCEHKDGFLHIGTDLQTHSADSRLEVCLPADGAYCVQVTDAQGQGGSSYAYRLRVGPPQPDFALRATPSSVSVPAGGAVPVTVYALRKDGFAGDIELRLKRPSHGFSLSGARIPAGRDQVRVTLIGPRERPDQPVVLELEGRAKIGGEGISRPVVPAEDMMQAFLYRHLTPSQVLMAAVVRGRLPAAEVVVEPATVQIPAGGTASVRLKMPGRALARRPDLELELNAPPAGITLEEVTRESDSLVLTLRADGESAVPRSQDNLIVEGFVEVDRPQQGDGAAAKKVRVSAGFLPAIPFVVVSQ